MGHAGRKRAFSRAAPDVSQSRRNDRALRNGVIDFAFAFDLRPRVDDVCYARARPSCLQWTQIAADTATGIELQRCQTSDLPIARWSSSRTRVSRGCQPLCHARHGESRGHPHQQQRHPDLEGLFLAARRQWILCRQRKMVPDSQFFIYSMSSSGGHSPWSFPMMVYSRQKNRIAGFSDMIHGGPTVSADFHFAGPHTLIASTWKQPGSLDDKIAVTVDLEEAFAKLPPSSD